MNYADAIQAILNRTDEQLFHISFGKSDELRCCVMKLNDDPDALEDEVIVLEESGLLNCTQN
ncbi:MAG: hypothetical protein IIB71_04975 [Proteobacteria bacterium]|nr:hypothetical protein [Pseudomonadota bacterium]